MESTSNNITSVEQLIRFKQGITTHVVVYSLRDVIGLLNDGALQKSEFNRNEVKARAGNADELFQTIAMGQCMGIVYASWDGTGKPKLTQAKPGKLSEGGHRVMRWIPKIRDGEALLFGLPLRAIETEHPELYKVIMTYKITFWITTHESGVVPESYMKSEYQRCNTMTALLTNGEVLRASENEAHNQLVERLLAGVVMQHKGTDTREKLRELATALVNGLLYGVDEINTKQGLVATASRPVTTEDQAAASRILEKYIAIEDAVLESFQEEAVPDDASRAEKARLKALNKLVSDRRKLFTGRTCSLAFDGVLLAALINTGDLERTGAAILKFYELSLSDKETWKANHGAVCEAGPGNSARYYNSRRFEHGWGRLQSIVDPRAVVISGGGGSGRIIA